MLSETEKYKLSTYDIKQSLHESEYCNIYLMQSSVDKKLYIKRVYKNSNMVELFSKIRNKKVRNIPEIYEIFYDNNDTIVIEEYILGHTVDSVNISKALFYKITNCILSSIEDLHSINIIHRDIKPSNIMITADHNIYLIDFGIARFYSDATDSDTTKSGTKGFASPEQYGFQQTDFKSDIYSIGKTMDYIIKANDIKANLKGVISKATAFDPGDRYKSAQELKSAVNLCRYAVALISVCVAFMLLAVLCVALMVNSKSKKTPVTNQYTEFTEATTQAIITESPEATSVLYEATTSSAKITTKASPQVKSPATANKPAATKQPQTAKQPAISTTQVPETSTAPPAEENSDYSQEVNILRTEEHKNYYSGIIVPEGTPYMEMIGMEKQKSCTISINNTNVTVECVREGLILTVNLSDNLGHKESLTMEFTQKEMDYCLDSPHSFNTYIYFIDYNNDGNIEIFVNYTDAYQYVTVAGIPRYSPTGAPVVIFNYNRIMMLEHTSKIGFFLYRNIMTPSYFNVEIDGSKYPGYIAVTEGSFMYKPENGTITENYM